MPKRCTASAARPCSATGLPAAEVWDLLDREFGGCTVVTDTGGGSVDDMWLAVLYESAGRE
jgi:hypothetical protein